MVELRFEYKFFLFLKVAFFFVIIGCLFSFWRVSGLFSVDGSCLVFLLIVSYIMFEVVGDFVLLVLGCINACEF